jgi:hypothetical protein
LYVDLVVHHPDVLYEVARGLAVGDLLRAQNTLDIETSVVRLVLLREMFPYR